MIIVSPKFLPKLCDKHLRKMYRECGRLYRHVMLGHVAPGVVFNNINSVYEFKIYKTSPRTFWTRFSAIVDEIKKRQIPHIPKGFNEKIKEYNSINWNDRPEDTFVENDSKEMKMLLTRNCPNCQFKYEENQVDVMLPSAQNFDDYKFK